MSLPAFTLLDALGDEALFQPWFPGESWDAWRTVLKGAFALSMTPEEVEQFWELAERAPPERQVRELWAIAGRRAGKDSIASVIAAYFASFYDFTGKLRPGEKAVVLCLACDRDQATIVLNYVRAFFERLPLLTSLKKRETLTGLELTNGVEIVVATNSFRAVRGRAIVLAILDEAAYWRDDRYASPDKETYNAIKPGLATLPGSMIVVISSGYRKAGLLYDKFKSHFGKPGDVLVVCAASLTLNPTLDPEIVAAALEEDPAAAQAEWLGGFRDDLEQYVDRDTIESLVTPGLRERRPVPGVLYYGFCDPAGGSGADAMTLGITHREHDIAVLDLLLEFKPPFSPLNVVDSFAEALEAYGIKRITGDRFGGEFVREPFRARGIVYKLSDLSASEIYTETLSLLNSGKSSLLDNPKMINQFCNLERRVGRSRGASISHPSGGHDDSANACAGALLLAARPKKSLFDQPAQKVAAPLISIFGR